MRAGAYFVSIAASVFLVAVTLVAGAPPKNGYVPDAETAIKIAVAVWSPIYGERVIAAEKPYRATLKDGVWTVQGSLDQSSDPPQVVGGVAYAEIAQKDGCILVIGHGE